ncbi:sodium-coupled monocarboxylate transporter 1-like [Oratosquilla oratoria]|uniref:sodium-coupled monocarboxylate transporter 1-like n=1 Tax=Oratosquilla oratoria TaxID=337810 RepID=UPI003F76BF05
MVLEAPSTVSPVESNSHATANASAGGESFGSGAFYVVDYVVFVGLTLASVVIGTTVAIRKKKDDSADDYLLGGRSMSIAPVALSLIGGFVSAISILGTSTEMYYYGTQLQMSLLGCLWGALIVTKVLLPVIYSLKLVSVYEYLELRFKSRYVKKLASVLQMASAAIYMGICLYAPSLTFSTVTDISTMTSIVIMGVTCAIYISIGGVRAVVYTDVLQTALMFSGVAVIVTKTTIDLGGVWNVLDIAGKNGRLEFFNLDPNPLVRHTFWSVQVLGINLMINGILLTQAQFQRLVSVSTLNEASWLCYLFVIGLTVLWSLFNFSGLMAYALYRDCDPLTAGLIEKKDSIIPYLVVDRFGNGWGMVGLFVAAVYGGVLSSVSSSANALAALFWKDFISEMTFFSRMTEVNVTRIIKLLSLVSGLCAIALAMLVSNMGTIFQLSNVANSVVCGPVNGLFLAGICAPWVSTKGAVGGFFTTIVINILFMVGKTKYSAGNSDPLPASVDGCPPNLLVNASICTNATKVITSMDANCITTEAENYPPIFDLSYCYFGVTGMVLVFIMASVFSLFTGLVHPDDVDPRMVNRTSLKIYIYLWRRFTKQEIKGFERVKTVEEKIKMDEESSSLYTKGLDTNERKWDGPDR